MAYLFISYSHQDREYVQKLGDTFHNKGIDYWMDNQLATGHVWTDSIEEKIANCAAVIVVASPDARKSSWVEREILAAENNGKIILPLLLKGETPGFLLLHRQYEDVRGNQIPSDRFFEKIHELIAKIENDQDANKVEVWKRLTSMFLDPGSDGDALVDAGYRISWYFPTVTPEQREFFKERMRHASDDEVLNVIAAIHEVLEENRDDVAENIAELFEYLPNNVERLKSLARGRQCQQDHLEALFQSIELFTQQFEEDFRDEIAELYNSHE